MAGRAVSPLETSNCAHVVKSLVLVTGIWQKRWKARTHSRWVLVSASVPMSSGLYINGTCRPFPGTIVGELK